MFCCKYATYYMEKGSFYHKFLGVQMIVQFGKSKI